jgi:hypothetical protein
LAEAAFSGLFIFRLSLVLDLPLSAAAPAWQCPLLRGGTAALLEILKADGHMPAQPPVNGLDDQVRVTGNN